MKEIDENSSKPLGESIVRHEGLVSKISDGLITVSLNGNLHCEACKAKSACGVSDSNSKEIEVRDSGASVQLNEPVEVFLRQDLGFKAVIWAYVLPFVLLLTVLLISLTQFEEWIAGLLAIGILVPYYSMLYVYRNSFKNAFRISILKPPLK